MSQKKSSSVDVLLGNDYYGLHPKKEIAKNGDHLSIMEGELGICLQGTHPRLAELTEMTPSVAEMHNVKTCSNFGHSKEGSEESWSYVCYSKREYPGVNSFISGKELGTKISRKCKACKCFKFPILGRTYFFQEQQETDLIKKDFKKKKIICSKRRISKWWKALDQNAIYKEGITKGAQWIFGPADSPWHQGAVESLVKAAKKCFKVTMGTQRLSPTEIHLVLKFQTY